MYIYNHKQYMNSLQKIKQKYQIILQFKKNNSKNKTNNTNSS